VPSPLMRTLRDALDAPDAPRFGEHVLVAVSGGPDSTALAAGLATLGPARGLVVTAGHVDHGLRGAESSADAAAVEVLARRLGIGCRVAVATVAPGPNLEARARDVRHRALRRIARDAGASYIALAHTLDDQVETMLLRLLRGAGRRGLGGMAPRRGRLWRPLLGATRADVRRHLAVERLPFRLDRTNADLTHARNRLRRLVLPLLAREFNPRLGASMAALAARLRDEDSYLDECARARLDVHLRADHLATAVVREPLALARRIVRAWLRGLGDHAPSATEVERVLALAAGRVGGNVAVRGPARIVREGALLVRRAGRESDGPALHCEIAPGGVLDDPEHAWRLAISTPRARGPNELAGLSARRARFDADALPLPLVVRSVRAGDRIDVPGVGTRKLQDVLVDAKVPREHRRTVPIVVDATGRVLWVAGIVRGAAALLTDTTTQVVEMDLTSTQ
jgi:tRNA(Ile)-lysidine synthase